MKTVRLLALISVRVPDDFASAMDRTLPDEVMSAFFEPDVDDSIGEALSRYMYEDVEACVLDLRQTRRMSLRKGRLA